MTLDVLFKPIRLVFTRDVRESLPAADDLLLLSSIHVTASMTRKQPVTENGPIYHDVGLGVLVVAVSNLCFIFL